MQSHFASLAAQTEVWTLNFFIMLIVLTTTPNAEEAEILARKVVESKLAACVQILPQMKSVYFWDGTIQNDNEN